MLKIIKRLFPLEEEGTINKLRAENEQLKKQNRENEEALVELAQMASAQDEALVEIAALIGNQGDNKNG